MIFNFFLTGEVERLLKEYRQNQELVRKIGGNFYQIIYPVQLRHHEKMGISTREVGGSKVWSSLGKRNIMNSTVCHHQPLLSSLCSHCHVSYFCKFSLTAIQNQCETVWNFNVSLLCFFLPLQGANSGYSGRGRTRVRLMFTLLHFTQYNKYFSTILSQTGKHFHRTSLLIKAFNHKFRLDLELNT